MPSVKSVVGHEEDQNACPYHTAPVHLTWCWAWSSRKELEDPKYYEKAERNDVNRIASFSKIESRSWECFAAQSLLENAWKLVSKGFKFGGESQP